MPQDSHTDANTTPTTGYLKDKAYLALVTAYDKEKGIATLTQRNKMSVGDKVEILSPGKTGRSTVVRELFDENGVPIPATPHPYMVFSMKLDFEVGEGDLVRLA